MVTLEMDTKPWVGWHLARCPGVAHLLVGLTVEVKVPEWPDATQLVLLACEGKAGQGRAGQDKEDKQDKA